MPSESETTPNTSFAEGTHGAKSQPSTVFPTPSPRKLEAIALVSARFNLIHPPEIKITPSTPVKATEELNENPSLACSMSDTILSSPILEKGRTGISEAQSLGGAGNGTLGVVEHNAAVGATTDKASPRNR